MKQLEYDDLLKIRATRKLSEAEHRILQERLSASPALAEQWREDAALHRAIQQLPPAPISSNFTAQVLRKIELESRAAQRPGRWLPPFWIRGLAYGSLAIFAVGGGWHYHKLAERTELAKSVSTVTTVAQLVSPVAARSQFATEFPPMPPVDVWENFEAIRRLPAEVDMELLLALQ